MKNRSLDNFLIGLSACYMREAYTESSYAQAWRKLLRDRYGYAWLAKRLKVAPECDVNLSSISECPGCTFSNSMEFAEVKRLVPPRVLFAALPKNIQTAIRGRAARKAA